MIVKNDSRAESDRLNRLQITSPDVKQQYKYLPLSAAMRNTTLRELYARLYIHTFIFTLRTLHPTSFCFLNRNLRQVKKKKERKRTNGTIPI